ncbi:LysR family transcriptional regulator [Escherichia coli]|nr:LysR family transcriptional regulator [Escherichia coli]EHE8243650.1 LysR family transcriptional regulator [Escherichia coli]
MEPLREIRNRLLNGWQLSKMHTFEVAARHQSFALAAEELSLSPSAVSHRINQLEEELGIQLFVRSHRKVELTHEGKRVYWALKSSLDTLNQEILDIKNQELSGTLTLYSRPSIAQCWLVPALGDFTRRYQSLAAAEATGGLGSTATSNQLATIAPTLGQSWLSNQMSNYNNLANVGLGALQGQANAGQTYANNMSSIAQQSAALSAANANKPSSLQTAISGGTSGAIAGAGLASLLGTSTPWGAGIGAGIGLLGSLF